MHKHLDPAMFLTLPSGNRYHPCRLIIRDGTLMWKQALISGYLPTAAAQEAHITKTAQRLEELTSWLPEPAKELGLQVLQWFDPREKEYQGGIRCSFTAPTLESTETFELMLPHIQSHEGLRCEDDVITFVRC